MADLDFLTEQERSDVTFSVLYAAAKDRHPDFDQVVVNDVFKEHAAKDAEFMQGLEAAVDVGEYVYDRAQEFHVGRINRGEDVSDLGLGSTEADSLESILGR